MMLPALSQPSGRNPGQPGGEVRALHEGLGAGHLRQAGPSPVRLGERRQAVIATEERSGDGPAGRPQRRARPSSSAGAEAAGGRRAGRG